MDIKWVCKEESQEDDDRDILEEETALDVIANFISSFIWPYQLHNLLYKWIKKY